MLAHNLDEALAPITDGWVLGPGIAASNPTIATEKVSSLYFEQYIVTEPGITPLKAKELLTEEDYLAKQDEFGEDSFSAGIGATTNNRAAAEKFIAYAKDAARARLLRANGLEPA